LKRKYTLTIIVDGKFENYVELIIPSKIEQFEKVENFSIPYVLNTVFDDYSISGLLASKDYITATTEQVYKELILEMGFQNETLNLNLTPQLIDEIRAELLKCNDNPLFAYVFAQAIGPNIYNACNYEGFIIMVHDIKEILLALAQLENKITLENFGRFANMIAVNITPDVIAQRWTEWKLLFKSSCVYQSAVFLGCKLKKAAMDAETKVSTAYAIALL